MSVRCCDGSFAITIVIIIIIIAIIIIIIIDIIIIFIDDIIACAVCSPTFLLFRSSHEYEDILRKETRY